MRRLAARLLLAQGADAATFLAFYILARPTLHSERNGPVLALMAIGGIWLVAAVKLGVAGTVAWRATRPLGPSRVGPLRRWHERHPRVVSAHGAFRVVGLSAATASGIAGAGFNLASLVHTLAS